MSSNLEDRIADKELFPKVSVIVPIYNGEADLPDLLDSLRSQTYPTDLVEYLLVDNNSTDRTASILTTAEKEAISQGINIRHLNESKIQSSYAARNKAIKCARGDILAFTDADCRLAPDWLQQLVIPFVNATIAIVVGEIVALPGKTLLEKYAEYCGVMSQKFLLEHPFCPYGQTANLAIRREAFSKVGLFRPYLTTGGDADICWRIQRETDWQIDFAPKAIIYHRHRANLRELRSQWRRYGRSNKYLHQLHGVELMRELQPKESFYRLARWLIKELPQNGIKAIAGKTSFIELIKTPIDLIGFQARTQGQRESELPVLAQEIEWL